MEVLHNIGHRWESDQVRALNGLGIAVIDDVFSWVSLTHTQFESVRQILRLDNAMYAVGADFDKSDITDSRWLALTGLSAFGYPQPDDVFEYPKFVYDLSKCCKTCGIHGTQTSPFRIKSDRIKCQAYQLEWVDDAIFVTKDIYSELFAPLGVCKRPVLIHRSGEESEIVVQLDLPECEWSFDMTGVEFGLCIECGRKKYSVRPMDFLPALGGEPPNQIFRGNEFFGSGAKADQRIYLSQELMQEFVKRKIANWYQFYPLSN